MYLHVVLKMFIFNFEIVIFVVLITHQISMFGHLSMIRAQYVSWLLSQIIFDNMTKQSKLSHL